MLQLRMANFLRKPNPGFPRVVRGARPGDSHTQNGGLEQLLESDLPRGTLGDGCMLQVFQLMLMGSLMISDCCETQRDLEPERWHMNSLFVPC